MSPYAFKLARLTGAALCSWSFLEGYFKITKAAQGVPPYVWFGLAAIFLISYVVFYFWEISELDKRTGFYIPVRKLKKIDVDLARALRIYPYYDYYGKRREDDEVRAFLAGKGGVVILGKPYSGKTRAALEAVAETHPDAYLLSFTSPDRLTLDTVKEIVLPCFFIFVHKPKLVLLIDDVEKFAGRPFGELLARLREQSSGISIVATCRTGIGMRALADSQIQQLLRGVPSVELGPLDAQTSAKIYADIWKHDSPPLAADISLPGLIVFGPKEMRDSYLALAPKRRRVITALRLAYAVGAVACERQFLADILKQVLEQDPAGMDESILQMEKDYIVLIDHTDRVCIQHEEFLYEDYRSYYRTLLEFKKDLQKVESLLATSRDADRLLQLGLYYWTALWDIVSARRVLEASLQYKQSPFVNGSLARLYVWHKEPERARLAINAAVEATKKPNDKALALQVFADELLYKFLDGEKALGWYALALEQATDADTKSGISFRYADCLVLLKRFSEAEPRYREYLAAAPDVGKTQATSRLFLSVVAQNRNDEAQAFLRQAASGLAEHERLALALAALENSEGFFRDTPSCLERAWIAVWDEYREWALGFTDRNVARDLLTQFAIGAFGAGFLAPARAAYRFLVSRADEFSLAGRDLCAAWIDLGAALRDVRQFSEARVAFDRAKGIISQMSNVKNLQAYAIAGLADCDLFEKQDVTIAEPGYRKARDLGKEAADESAISWATMGSGDIYILRHEFIRAKESYLEIPYFGNSVSGLSRMHLGLAQATLELGELDDAEFHIGTGFACTVRLDYQFRRKQFEELHERLAKKQEEANAISSIEVAAV